MERRIDERVRSELEAALYEVGWGSALRFAEEVVLQCAYPLGEPADHPSEPREAPAAEAVLAVLRSAAAAAGARPSADVGDVSDGHLERDPVLLAAVFQNIDLLYTDRFPHADGVGALVMRALQLIEPEAVPPPLGGTAREGGLSASRRAPSG